MVLQPHPILFSTAIGTVYTHGLLFAMGALVGVCILLLQRRFLGLRELFIVECALWIFLVGIVSARVGYLVTYPNLWTQASQLFAIWQGGLISYWGMLGGGAVALGSGRKLPVDIRWRWYGMLTVAILTAWAIGRIGNYLAADSVGVISTAWHITYGRVPIQLFESALCFGIALWAALTVKKNPRRVVWAGWLAYFVGRFVIDTWRDENMIWILHNSQWVALLGIITILGFWKYHASTLSVSS